MAAASLHVVNLHVHPPMKDRWVLGLPTDPGVRFTRLAAGQISEGLEHT